MTRPTHRRSRGGKGGYEPGARIRLRELRVMQAVLEGGTQRQIAADLGISQAAVSRIVARVEARLLHDVTMQVERQRARHTFRLEFLYAEAVRSWRGSQADRLQRRQRRRDGASGGGGETVAEIVSEARHGDPRYLEAARRVLEDLRRLWGVDAPERVAVETISPFASLSDAALRQELVRQTELVQRLVDVPAPAPAVKDA